MILTQRGILLELPLFLWILLFGAGQAHRANHAGQSYDDGGTFRITLSVLTTRRVQLLRKIDAFIWTHWQDHRRGKLEIIGQTIEGQTKMQKIFIDLDSHGRWHILDQEKADVHAGTRPAKISVVYDEVQRTDIANGQVIPASEKRAEGTYRLLLVNSLNGDKWVL